MQILLCCPFEPQRAGRKKGDALCWEERLFLRLCCLHHPLVVVRKMCASSVLSPFIMWKALIRERCHGRKKFVGRQNQQHTAYLCNCSKARPNTRSWKQSSLKLSLLNGRGLMLMGKTRSGFCYVAGLTGPKQ